MYPFLLGCVASFLVFAAFDRAPGLSANDRGGGVVVADVAPNRRSLRTDLVAGLGGGVAFDSVRQRQSYGHYSATGARASTRIVLGVFTTIEETERRRKLREYIFRNPSRVDPRLCSLNEFLEWESKGIDNGCRVLYTFVVGAGDPADAPPFYRSSWGRPPVVPFDDVERWTSSKVQGIAFEPDATYLNVRENMNEGKTPAWFKYASDLNEHGERLFDYAAKIDSDTLLSVPDLLHLLDNDLPVGEDAFNVYGGILCDQRVACERHDDDAKRDHCERTLHGRVYMTGQFYFLSADLAAYVGHDDQLVTRKAAGAGGKEQRRPKDENNKDERSPYSEDVDLALTLHDSNRVLRLVVLNNKNVFWLHNTKTNEKMDAKYIDYFVKQRRFPKYSFWIKPNWWP